MNIKCNTSQTNPTSQPGDFIISDQVISSNNYTKNNRGALQMETGTPAYRSHCLLPHHDCALCSPSTSCNCNPYESVLALHYEVQYWHWHTVTGPVFLLSPAPAAQGPLPPRQCSITWVQDLSHFVQPILSYPVQGICIIFLLDTFPEMVSSISWYNYLWYLREPNHLFICPGWYSLWLVRWTPAMTLVKFLGLLSIWQGDQAGWKQKICSLSYILALSLHYDLYLEQLILPRLVRKLS